MIDAALSDVFECPVEAIGETYQHFFTVWLKSAAIQSNLALPVFEEYPEGTSRRPVCIHVPIREQHEQEAGPRPVQSLTSKGLLKQVHGLLQRVQARHFLRNGPPLPADATPSP